MKNEEKLEMINDKILIIHPQMTGGDNSYIGPAKLREVITYLFHCSKRPKWLYISEPSLISKIQVVFFEGLDQSLYEKYQDLLPEFVSISRDGFPVSVVAHSKAGQFTPGISTMLGIHPKKKLSTKFNSYEEMILTPLQLYDNGLPIRDPPEVTTKLRCQFFNTNPLTLEELSEFEELPESVGNALPIISIDCEMIETNLGEECCRLSVVDDTGKVVTDLFLKPLGDIIDLRTEVSGITTDRISDAEFTSFECVKVLSQYASKQTIICGHSLENDFRAMHLIHLRVIDTSVIYNKDAAYPYKPSLSRLYQKYIKKQLRQENCSHDSIDDARAAMELIKYAMTDNIHKVQPKPQVPDLFAKIKSKVVEIGIFAPNDVVDYDGLQNNIKCVLDDDPQMLLNKVVEINNDNPSPVSFVFFNGLCKCEPIEEEEKKHCDLYNSYLKVLKENLSDEQIMLVYTGNGSKRRLSVDFKNLDPKFHSPGKDPNRKEEFEKCKRALSWIYYDK